MVDQTEPGLVDAPVPATARAVPSLYLNGLEIGLTLSDIRVVALVDGERQCTLHMSFTTAKTLATDLANAIRVFEQLTEHEIMIMAEVEKGMKKVKTNE